MTHRGVIMKRKLDREYKGLVSFVNDKKRHLRLAQIITCFRFPPKKCADILYKLCADKNDTDEMLDYLIPIIVDIYNDNYEFNEPEYYWRFNELASNSGDLLYAFKYYNEDSIGLSTSSKTKMSKDYFNQLLSNSDTALSIYNFRPVGSDIDD